MVHYSNSSMDTFNTCGKKYDLHYNARLRSNGISSPLFFGSAVDKALNNLLLQKKKILTEEETKILETPIGTIFLKALQIVDINGELVDISKSLQVSYFNKDFDVDFLTEEDVVFINEISPFELSLAQLADFKTECQATLKSGQELTEDIHKTYNYCCWLSLKNKGEYLIHCYKKYILPQIKEVTGIQQEVILPGIDTDFIKGYIDYTAIFESDSIERIIDNKTASAKYPADCIATTTQLVIYSEFMQNRNVGYIVMLKSKQKDPAKQIQVLFGKITEEQVKNVFDNIGEVVYNIKNGQFEENRESCFKYFTKCPYYDYCRTGDMKNLVKLEDR